MQRRSLLIPFLAAALLILSACASEPTPTPTQEATASAVVTTPEPITPQVGRWIGVAFGTTQQDIPPMQLYFDINEDGSLKGHAKFYPLNAPENAQELVTNNGCNVSFDALKHEDGTLDGQFISDKAATLLIRMQDCEIKFFGPMQLPTRVEGAWVVEYSQAATLALKQAANAPLTPLELGVGVFLNNCSACHGIYGQGAPGIPALISADVAKKSDDELRKIISEGVLGTEMPAWGKVLKPDEFEGVLVLLRDLGALR